MNSNRKLLNKKFLGLAMLVLLLVASFGLFNLTVIPSYVDASFIKFDNETTVSISNGSFSSFSQSSTYPYTLSSFTNMGNATPSLKSGAINISKDTYKNNYEKYGLDEYNNPNGTGTDNYILMINSNDTCGYGYVSSEFTLNANGHYYITVSVKTLDDSVASMYLLKDDDVFENFKIENISTGNTWCNYTFFVSTSSYESLTLKFGMFMGGLRSRSSGFVFFDELHAGEISKDTLTNTLSAFDDKTYVYKDFYTDKLTKSYTFGTTPNYFETVKSGVGDKSVNISKNAINITTNDTYVLYKGLEEVLEPNTTYKFSIYAKVSENMTSGSGFIKLSEILDEKEQYKDFLDDNESSITAKNASLNISSTTSNKANDDYVQYSVYVRTGALDTSKVQFSFGLGDESSATGSISFKDFTIERVSYSVYNNAATGSYVAKMDISERISLSSSEYANYTFDKMTSDSSTGTQYPAAPTDWTKKSSGNGVQLSGVVNLSKYDEFNLEYKDQINVFSAPTSLGASSNNNVLMIYNGAKSYQGYTSSVKSLSANKYYKITTFVNTKMWQDDYGVSIIAKTGSGNNYHTLCEATNIITNGAWQKVELIIHTPNESIDVSVELALGYKSESTGYAFFDNILLEEVSNKDDFSNRFGSIYTNKTVEVDLNDPFISLSTKKDYNAPLLYVGENATGYNVNAGVVNLENDLKAIISEDKIDSLRSLKGDSNKVLAISSVLNEDVYYKYTSVLQYNFESGKYYKFSVDAYTYGLGVVNKEDNKDKQTAVISLAGLENATFKVVSNGEWNTYEFYIGVNESCSSNVIFSLGSEEAGCYGSAFFGNIELSEIQKNEFENATTSSTVLKIDTIETTDEDDKEDEESSKSSSNNFSWIYVPTILTFVAIVVAVVGIFVKKNLKFKKYTKVKKVEYDRNDTVLQNKYRRQAIDSRNQEVRELTKECDELIALRTEYEVKYKDAINRLRTAKINNRDGSKKNQISAIEKEIKHISKEVSRYGVQINNYENEIEFMKTEAYIVSLEKSLMREHNLRSKINLMPEVEREIALEKNRKKQEKDIKKAEASAEKLAQKQAKLEQEKLLVEKQMQDAIEKDEKFVKEQELKKIQQEEEKVAKERAKAEKELEKLQQEAKLAEEKAKREAELAEERARQEAEELGRDTSEEIDENSVENTDTEVAENPVEEVENVEHAEVEQVENVQENVEEVTPAVDNESETAPVEKSIEVEQASVETSSENEEIASDNSDKNVVAEEVNQEDNKTE